MPLGTLMQAQKVLAHSCLGLSSKCINFKSRLKSCLGVEGEREGGQIEDVCSQEAHLVLCYQHHTHLLVLVAVPSHPHQGLSFPHFLLLPSPPPLPASSQSLFLANSMVQQESSSKSCSFAIFLLCLVTPRVWPWLLPSLGKRTLPLSLQDILSSNASPESSSSLWIQTTRQEEALLRRSRD